MLDRTTRQHLEAYYDRFSLASAGQAATSAAEFAQLRFKPLTYIREKLHWEPWAGTPEAPGQRDILAAYTLALKQQHERDKYERGLVSIDQLRFWQPGQVIKNWLRVEAGHTVGKTKLAAGIVSHFFDCCPNSIIYTYAPTWDQIKRLLWKEIAADRAGKSLPGRLMENCELKDSASHFAIGKAVEGNRTEAVQGQHGAFNLHILDEAEGLPDVLFNAVPSMVSGGISIVLLLANPRTRTSRFYRLRERPETVNFRLSCLNHPNVVHDREIVPGAVKRPYVEQMTAEYAAVVTAHNPDHYTFELPWQPGIVYQPQAEFMFRVLGIPPSSTADKCLIPAGRFEAATKRQASVDRPDFASAGLDCARWGLDVGALYCRHNGRVWGAAILPQCETAEYYFAVKKLAESLAVRGVKRFHLRVDAGGGFGGGVVDLVRRAAEIKALFNEVKVFEVNFGASGNAVHKPDSWRDVITELTADVAESLHSLATDSDLQLEEDLCGRLVEPANVQGRFVKKLEEKDKFRARYGRSPDRGDAFVLAAASEFLFTETQIKSGRIIAGNY